jgi:hypothetical protein
MKLRTLLSVPLFCLAGLAAHADDKWQVTTSFEMTGMPFQMPPHSQEICLAPGQKADEQGIKSNKDCDVSNVKRSGRTLSFHMECHKHGNMSGDGKITSGTDSYQGEMTMSGNFGQGGQASTMHMNFSGKKEGSCDGPGAATTGGPAAYPYGMDPNLMQRQQQMAGAAMDQQCVAMLKQWDQMPQAFVGDNAFCKKQGPNYCKTVAAEINKAASPDAYKTLVDEHPNWQTAAEACGIDASKLAQKTCDTAKSQKNWAAVAKVCPDAETLAKANCTGRSYSAIMVGEYGPLCQAYSQDITVTGGTSSSVINTGSSVMDGVNKLRGFFGR